MTSLLIAAAISQTQAPPEILTYTKNLRPGVTYTQEVRTGDPLIIYSLKFKYPSEGLRFETRLAKDEVYSRDKTTSRETVDSIAKRNGAFAAINADYFGWDGDPLGVQLSRGGIVSEPLIPRAAAAWSDTAIMFDSPKSWKAQLLTDEGNFIDIDGVNRSCRANEAILNTRAAGVASSKEACYAFVFEMTQDLAPGKNVDMRFKLVLPEQYNVPVKEGEAVLMVTQAKGVRLISQLRRDTTYVVHCDLEGGIDWKTVREAIGGGPWILKGGKPFITNLYERFDTSMANRHPRTAIGASAAGEIVWCVVDGRSDISRGATFEELASIMQKLGCVDAINLDGGGSSTMVIQNQIVNRTSDGPARPVANALCIFLPDQAVPAPKVTVVAKTNPLKPGDVTTLKVTDEAGAELPSAEVIWTSRGAAGWVDAGGTFRAKAAGIAKVTAAVRGAEATLDLTITKPEPKRGGNR